MVLLAIMVLAGAAWLAYESRGTSRAVAPLTTIGQIPRLQQQTKWTCGPVALRAVLAHYGYHISEEDAAQAVDNVPVQGIDAAGIVKGAETLGFFARHTRLRDLAAVDSFLERGIPVIVTVDSWTKPGQQGHWCVVVAVKEGNVHIMDPNTPGNVRVLSEHEFEKKWWNYCITPDGGIGTERHTAVVVFPQALIGAEEAKPTHGRTARCEAKGGLGAKFATIWKGMAQTAVTVFTYGAATKLSEGALSELSGQTRNMNAQQFSAWINQASNEEVTLWAIDWAKKRATSTKKVWRETMTTAVVSADDFADGVTVARAAEAAMRVLLLVYGSPILIPTCQAKHALQAIGLAVYGPKSLAALDEALVRRPKRAPWKTWLEATMVAVEQVREETSDA